MLCCVYGQLFFSTYECQRKKEQKASRVLRAAAWSVHHFHLKLDVFLFFTDVNYNLPGCAFCIWPQPMSLKRQIIMPFVQNHDPLLHISLSSEGVCIWKEPNRDTVFPTRFHENWSNACFFHLCIFFKLLGQKKLWVSQEERTVETEITIMSIRAESSREAAFYNQSSNQEGKRRKKKTKGKNHFPIKRPNYTSEKIWSVLCSSGFPWRQECLPTITGTMCGWSPCNIKSLFACSHEEAVSPAFLECPQIRESWLRVKASKKQ